MASKKPKFRFHFYKFLNKPGYETTAYIAAQVKKSPKGFYSERDYNDVEAELFIKDCDRQISFMLSVSDDGNYNNTMFKLQTLVDGITGLMEALTEENEKRKSEREEK